MTAPKPQTKRALLWSDGKRRFTWHNYVGTYETYVPYSHILNEEHVGGSGWEHVFECSESGAQRRWGFEDNHKKDVDLSPIERNHK